MVTIGPSPQDPEVQVDLGRTKNLKGLRHDCLSSHRERPNRADSGIGQGTPLDGNRPIFAEGSLRQSARDETQAPPLVLSQGLSVCSALIERPRLSAGPQSLGCTTM